MEALVAGDIEAVFVFGEGGSHGFEVFRYEGDAVGLFDAKLAGVSDGDAVDGVGGYRGNDREFIDDLGGEGSSDVLAAWAGGGAVELDGADECAVMLFDGEDFYFSTQGGDDVQEGGPGGIHANGVEDK